MCQIDYSTTNKCYINHFPVSAASLSLRRTLRDRNRYAMVKGSGIDAIAGQVRHREGTVSNKNRSN